MAVRDIGSDPEAFTAFYREHVDDVTRFVARRVGDPYVVADLVAEVFLAAIEASAAYRGAHGGPRTWLFGIARNTVAAEYRRSARVRDGEALVVGRRLLESDDIERLVERIDAHRSARGLHESLDRLPDGERAVLELVAVDGMTVTEAARALRIRPVTARVRLHRARQTMRAALSATPILESEVLS